jgi:hypothetical protein
MADAPPEVLHDDSVAGVKDDAVEDLDTLAEGLDRSIEELLACS